MNPQGDDELDYEADLEADPDLKFLLPPDEQPDTPPAPPAPPADDLSPQDRALFRVIRDNPDLAPALLKREGQPTTPQPPTPPAPPAPQPPADPTAGLDEFAKRFSDDFLANPQEAMKKFLYAQTQMTQAQVRAAEQRVREEFGQYASSNARSAITAETDRALGDPVMADPEVRAEFLAMVEEAKKAGINPNITPEQIRTAMDSSIATAFGRVEMRRRSRRSAAPAPNYTPSSRNNPPASPARMRLTEDERGLVSNLRAAGKSDELIRKTLQEYRKEMGRA